MIIKVPLRPERLRRITGSFSWVDHRLVSDGFLQQMSQQEILLYFFLVLVGDKNGLSYYSYDRICGLLKIDPDDYLRACRGLEQKALIAYEKGLFQVLQLPEKSLPPAVPTTDGGPRSLRELLKNL
jgi:hypothetical protein